MSDGRTQQSHERLTRTGIARRYNTAMPSGSLDPYEKKRDFEKTPEPAARKVKARGRGGKPPVFVIHRHDARNLHYDLRLEMDGVLKSWAVPKGFSYDPKDKKFAVQTEDHPIEYEDFHGLIPSGNYGAGPMTIWDRGTFEVLGELEGPQAIADGKLELWFDGGRLRGEWHMVKLKDEKSGWLLFKGKDRYSRNVNEPVFAIDVHATQRSKFPRKRKFMEAKGSHAGVLAGNQWLYEPSLAGVRIFAEKRGEKIKLRTGAGKDVSSKAGRVVSELQRIRAENALIDGVLVMVDPKSGLPDGKLTNQIVAGNVHGDLSLYVFDLVYFDEWDLHEFPLAERKAALLSLLTDRMFLQYVEHERMRPAALLIAIQTMRLDGAIAKRIDSIYEHNPSDAWRHIDCENAETATTPKIPKSSARVKFTNRTRVLWPQAGITKGDLIDYCDEVADTLVRYIADRPLSLNRYPDGINGKSFFQKGAPKHTPEWIRTQKMDSSNKEGHVNYIICDERDTLLYLANLAAIELHPWHSRCGTPDTPDWAILDLDPYGADFTDVITIARTIGEILRDAGLDPLLKTSGSKGLHIYVAVEPGYTYDHARMFCEGVARLTCIRHPKIATVERKRSERVGQVYVDFMQNRRGQTIAAPYSVRPVEGACVSTPLAWDELDDDPRPSHFTVHTVPHRLETLGDLFAGAIDEPQDLLPAINAIREML